MSLIEDTPHKTHAGNGDLGSVSDYVALLKPRVMSLVVFTALVGIVLAPGAVHPVLAAIGLLAIAVGAGAAGALNMWYDADIDAKMRRTANRPVARGRIEAAEALAFGIILAAGSVMVMGLAVNWLAAGLLAFTILFYVVVYTMWLKRRTPQNIVIGGAAGAFPPMIGWAVVTGGVSLESIVLFLIIFFWTPPHFWALALVRADDYAKVGVPMLPVVAGRVETARQILIYSILLAPLGVLPAVLGFAGPLYGAASAVLGVVFLAFAGRVFADRQGEDLTSAKQLFAFSVLYLFLLFALLLVERLIGIAPFAGLIG